MMKFKGFVFNSVKGWKYLCERMYRGFVVILLTISTSAELTLKLMSKLSEASAQRKIQILHKEMSTERDFFFF